MNKLILSFCFAISLIIVFQALDCFNVPIASNDDNESRIEYSVSTYSTETEMIVNLRILKLPGSKSVYLPHRPSSVTCSIEGQEFHSIVHAGPFVSLPYNPLTVSVEKDGDIFELPMLAPVTYRVQIGEVFMNSKRAINIKDTPIDHINIAIRSAKQFWKDGAIVTKPEIWTGSISVPIQNPFVQQTEIDEKKDP